MGDSHAPSARRPALILLPNLGLGGSERKFVRTSNVLVRRGYPVHLGYFGDLDTLRPDVDPAVEILHLRRRGKFSFGALRRLMAHVRDHDLRSVLGVNFYPLSYIVPASRLLRRPAMSWLASVNTTRFVNSREERFMLLNAPLLRRVDHTVFGCRAQLDHWVSTYRLPASRASIVYNGVDTAFFDPAAVATTRAEARSAYGFGADDFVIVCVGLLRPEKGQLDLVEALALATREAGADVGAPRLLLVGDGAMRAEIEARVAALGLTGRVVFAGNVLDVRPYLLAADVFALPSLSETLSNAALEAAAMGLPLLLSDIEGNLELAAHDDCGLLYAVGEPASLSTRLLQLMRDDDRRRLFGERARAAARTHFSVERMADDWARLLWPASAAPSAAADDRDASARTA